jgi:hypothetical protein
VAKAWDAGRREGRWDHQHLSNEEEKRTQSGIDATMRSVIADQLAGRAFDPWKGSAGGPKAAPAGAVVASVPCEGVPQPEQQAQVQGEPWRPANPERIDWIRNGAGRSLPSLDVPDVRSANIASAEAQLAKLEKEEE